MQDTLQVPQQVEFIIERGKLKFYTKLQLKNLESRRKAFKILTNSKERYIVTPASSLLDPYQSFEVEMSLTLPSFDIKLESLSNDRFRLIVADAQNELASKATIEEYFKKNENSVKKLTIGVVLNHQEEFFPVSERVSGVFSSFTNLKLRKKETKSDFEGKNDEFNGYSGFQEMQFGNSTHQRTSNAGSLRETVLSRFPTIGAIPFETNVPGVADSASRSSSISITGIPSVVREIENARTVLELPILIDPQSEIQKLRSEVLSLERQLKQINVY